MRLKQVKIVTGGPKQLAYLLDKTGLTIWMDDGLIKANSKAQFVSILEGNTTWKIMDIPTKTKKNKK